MAAAMKLMLLIAAVMIDLLNKYCDVALQYKETPVISELSIYDSSDHYYE